MSHACQTLFKRNGSPVSPIMKISAKLVTVSVMLRNAYTMPKLTRNEPVWTLADNTLAAESARAAKEIRKEITAKNANLVSGEIRIIQKLTIANVRIQLYFTPRH